MANNTYVPLYTNVLASTATSYQFTSIPATYTDLVLVVSGTFTTGSTNNCNLEFNNDTGSNYGWTRLLGNGTAASSARGTSDVEINVGLISSTAQSNTIIHIQNYSNTTTYKTAIGRGNTSEYVQTSVGTWRSTAAITAIKVKSAGTFSIGTKFSLYGIKAWAAEETPKATGGYVYSDSTYWYHAFPFSSTFTPLISLSADVLTVAGGGGGGSQFGGGGGAGGLVYLSSQSLTAIAYSLTVGAGGVGVTASTGGSTDGTGKGTDGSNSQFGVLTAATGGGGGGRYRDSNANNVIRNGADGGSGGGGGAGTNASYVGSGGTGSQGNNGGSGGAYGSPINSYRGGGGGGAGVVGGNANSSGGGTGGNGSSTYSSWGSATGFGEPVAGTYYFAGGGGGGGSSGYQGGVGGYGGGGLGGNDSGLIYNGLVSTGGGGGSTGYGGYQAGANAGSGLIIVRYAK